MTVFTSPGLPTAVVSWNAAVNVTDNSGSAVLTSNYESGDLFPIGISNVVYTATDDSGNTERVSFVVTVYGNLQMCKVYTDVVI